MTCTCNPKIYCKVFCFFSQWDWFCEKQTQTGRYPETQLVLGSTWKNKQMNRWAQRQWGPERGWWGPSWGTSACLCRLPGQWKKLASCTAASQTAQQRAWRICCVSGVASPSLFSLIALSSHLHSLAPGLAPPSLLFLSVQLSGNQKLCTFTQLCARPVSWSQPS